MKRAGGPVDSTPQKIARSGEHGKAAAGGASKGMLSSLMLPGMKPFRPQKPSPEEITAGRAGSVRTYMDKLCTYVKWHLSVFLYKDPIVQLRKPLYTSVCPDVMPSNAAASGAAWRPTSIMEPLVMEHCISALTHSDFYEGTVSIWNLDPMATRAFGTPLNLTDPSWLQLDVLTELWSEGNLALSHQVQGKQRYFFPEIVQTFVKDIQLLQSKMARDTGLRDMPVSGGHELCWSFFCAVDAALEASDERRVRLLWEVSNQVTVRMRINPTQFQIGIDRLAMSDRLRVKFEGTGARCFFSMCTDIFSMWLRETQQAH